MRSGRRGYLAAAVLGLTAVGCGSGDIVSSTAPSPSTTAPTSLGPTTTVVDPSSTVVLDDAGALPRRRLGLRLAAGSTARIATVTKQTFSLAYDGSTVPADALPAVRTVQEQRVDRVDADGTGHFTITYVDVSVMPTPGVDAAVATAVQAGQDLLKDIRITGTVDVRAKVSKLAFDTRAVADAATKSRVDELPAQFIGMAGPFPSEPVGVGARWTAMGSVTLFGITMTTTTHFTLRNRSGDRYELDQTQSATAPSGPAALPNLPAGATAKVVDFSMHSTGKISGDLTRQLATRSSSNAVAEGSLIVSVDGQRNTLIIGFTVDSTVSTA